MFSCRSFDLVNHSQHRHHDLTVVAIALRPFGRQILNTYDVLEYLRPKVQKLLTNKDERDLFDLVNNFDIRRVRTTRIRKRLALSRLHLLIRVTR